MAPVETTDAATVNQRCSFKRWAGWRHNHSNSKLCVAVRMGQANLFRTTNCHLCAGAMLSSRSNFQRLDLCVSSLCKPCFRIVQKNKNYPSQILTVILAQGPCSNIQSHTIFVQSRAAVSRRRNSVILAQGPCNIVQRKRRRQAQSEVRTSGPALEGTIISPLVNTTSGLSGGRRGGDVSGAAPAPSLVVARLLARALALDLACGICCPPFFIRKAYASDGSSTPRRKSSAMR